MGRYQTEDIVLYLQLLELHMMSNPNRKTIKKWKNNNDSWIPEVYKTTHYIDLIEECLAIKNKQYNPNLFERWNHTMRNFSPKYTIEK